jgi:chromate transporter
VTAAVAARGPGRLEALRYGLRLGCISFGGPAGQIGILHREVVDERGWLADAEFVRALNLCMLLPGPEALQLVIYLGWRWHGALGGIVAGLCFLLPASLLLTLLSFVWVLYGTLTPVAAIVAGLQCVVVALVLQAVQRLARRALTGSLQRLVALAAFAALAFGHAPFLVVLAVAGVVGRFALLSAAAPAPPPPPPWRRTIQHLLLGFGAWLLPWLLLRWAVPGSRPERLYLYFSKVALGGFGGAYAVLAYVNQELVSTLGWLGAKDLLAGLALSETTPGPLVIVLQFYGFVAGWNAPGVFRPAVAALACAALASWALFLPSFVLVIALAPWVDRLLASRALAATLAGVTAAVVGVIGAFALTVAVSVLFPAGLWVPQWSSVAIAAGAWGLLTRTQTGLGWVLAGGAAASLLVVLVAG